MQFKIFKKNVLQYLGNTIAKPLINVLCNTLKIEEVNKAQIDTRISSGQNLVFAFWHGTMLAPWYQLKKYQPSAIVSKSKDGDILVNILQRWGYEVERGSSSKSGKEVLEKLVEKAKQNRNITITPDGPRGPEKIMKPGAVIIAKKANVPLVLVGVNYDKKRILKSWDKFEVPKFFSKVKIIYSDPIEINQQLDYDATDTKIKEIGKRLNEIQEEARISC